MRVIMHTVTKMPSVLQSEAWSAALMLLCWARSRGTLPPDLALINDGFSLQAPLSDSEPLSGSPPHSAAVAAHDRSLPPSIYAHRCYLEAYGLVLERGGQSRAGAFSTAHGSIRSTQAAMTANQNGGWLDYLFAAPTNESETHPMLTSPSGTLDLPNLYRNTNASAFIDMTGNPLRPDDEILKVCLARCDPSLLIFQTVADAGESTRSLLLDTMLQTLSSMLEVLTAPPRLEISVPQRSIPPFKRTCSASTVGSTGDATAVPRLALAADAASKNADDIDEEGSFPEHLTSHRFVSNETRELDAVAMLEWTTTIILKNEENLLRYWTGLFGEAFFVA